MKNKLLLILGTVSLVLVLLVGSVKTSWAIQKVADFKISSLPGSLIAQSRWSTPTGVPVKGCSSRPKLYPPKPNIETAFVPGILALDRFRQVTSQATLVQSSPSQLPPRGSSIQSPPPQRPSRGNPFRSQFPPQQNSIPVPPPSNPFPRQPLTQPRYYSSPLSSYQPREEIALANPTNFGERYFQDVDGNPVSNDPIIVLHETVSAGWSAVRMFQTYHANDDDQSSYHTLVKLDGTVFYLVPPDKRAFGAGNSVFEGAKGIEGVKTNRLFPPSVNNFAYHISFESPVDGRGNGRSHSGYTDAQYKSAAWLVARTGVPEERVTTHKGVDRSRTRIDPRSFDMNKFRQYLSAFPKTQEIVIGCPTATPTVNPSNGSF
jgi:N-acetylmuramoyl-L-alanine amidase